MQATSAGIDYKVSCSVPPNVIVHIDQMKLSQVIRNLVSNALKFTPKEGTIELTCEVLPIDYEDNTEIYFTNSMMRDRVVAADSISKNFDECASTNSTIS